MTQASAKCMPTPLAAHGSLAELIAFDTSPDGASHEAAVRWLEAQLESAQFVVRRIGAGKAPLLMAHRAAIKGAHGRVLMYGHYDVDHVEPGWNTPPFALSRVAGRLCGLGIADNKGALSARLMLLKELAPCPEVLWLLQGEEESGSTTLHAWLEENGLPAADWYIDENGWTRPDGVQRVLTCEVRREGVGAVDSAMAACLLEAIRDGWTSGEIESRMLNKKFVPGGCWFQRSLPLGARYIAIGTNDALTRIHAPNESIAEDSLEKHARGLRGFLLAVGHSRL